MKVIIIAGCQRSGTTLIGQMIGAHSQGFMIDESDGLYQWTDAWLSNAGNQFELLNQVIKTASVKYADERHKLNNRADLANRFLILKAPNLTFYANQISQLHDQVSVVYPIRDIRAVVASMLQLKQSKMISNQTNYFLQSDYIQQTYGADLARLVDVKTEPHIKAAIIWKIKNLLIHRFELKNLNPLLVKYENLIGEPIAVAKKMASHCLIEYQDNMNLHHHFMNGRGPGKTMRDRKIDDSSLQKWVTQLASSQVCEIMEVGRQTMSDFNYEFSTA